MEPDYNEAKRYQQVRKKVKEIREFYEHLMIFILVSILLIVINLMTSPEYLWFFWCLSGWGIGVVVHGLKVFGVLPFFNKEWEERKIKEFMNKEKESSKQTWK